MKLLYNEGELEMDRSEDVSLSSNLIRHPGVRSVTLANKLDTIASRLALFNI